MMGSNFDFERIWQGKRALRRQLAEAPIVEKLRLLDAMRERALTICNATDRPAKAVQENPSGYGKAKC
jgi:hypothetical protein